MPRPLVFSNGRLLVGLDGALNIREIFYPHVGLYDHLGGRMIRCGVWVNGEFSWFDNHEWTRKLGYREDCLVSICRLRNERLGVEIEIEDAVDPERTVFARRMTFVNLRTHPLDLRVFFNQDLKIAESDTGLCAFYHRASDSYITYKGPFAFLFSGQLGGAGLAGYNSQVRRYNHEDGTWWDCEDGELGMNPICQGAIDSSISLRTRLDVGEHAEGTYWMVVEPSIEESVETYAKVRANPSVIFDRSREAGVAQLRELKGLEGLPEDLANFARRSYLILKTQIDADGGILAANDSDIMISNRAHYSYVWPRDGSLVARVLDRLGDHEAASRYFGFCERADRAERGYFLQKYAADATVGASWHPWLDPHVDPPLQEDETSLTVLALCEHLDFRPEDGERWAPFLRRMVGALLRLQDGEGWPVPSHDLWEERKGVHAFTVASIIVALEAAAKRLPDEADECLATAKRFRDHLLTEFPDPHTGAFRRTRLADGHFDPTLDSSTLQVALLGAIPVDHPIAKATRTEVENRLSVPGPVGGLARYPHDWYWRVVEHAPGNPWPITSLWLAQTEIALASSLEDLEAPLAWLRWAERIAGPTGVLPEQLHPETGEHLSVSPLTWSHSEVLKTALDWAAKAKELGQKSTGRK